MTRIAFFLLFSVLSLFSTSSYAEHRILVRHSQTITEPSCPAGYIKMHGGYSFLGVYYHKGRRASQDLGDMGSCLEKFHPNVGIQCTTGDCDYNTDTLWARTMWLVTERFQDEGPTNYGTNPTEVLNHVSRCAVCEGTSPVLVKHSQSASVPACPTGWSSLWDGYSLAMAAFTDGGDAGQNLGDTGSCLPKFVPNPAYECYGANWGNQCDYDGGWGAYQMWLLNLESRNDTAVRYHNNGNRASDNIGRISRCNVCRKN